jgi:hypothetical protein
MSREFANHRMIARPFIPGSTLIILTLKPYRPLSKSYISTTLRYKLTVLSRKRTILRSESYSSLRELFFAQLRKGKWQDAGCSMSSEEGENTNDQGGIDCSSVFAERHYSSQPIRKRNRWLATLAADNYSSLRLRETETSLASLAALLPTYSPNEQIHPFLPSQTLQRPLSCLPPLPNPIVFQFHTINLSPHITTSF